MSIGQTALRLERPVQDVAADVEQGGLLILAREIVVKDIVRAVRPVVECVAHRPGFGQASDIGG